MDLLPALSRLPPSLPSSSPPISSFPPSSPSPLSRKCDQVSRLLSPSVQGVSSRHGSTRVRASSLTLVNFSENDKKSSDANRSLIETLIGTEDSGGFIAANRTVGTEHGTAGAVENNGSGFGIEESKNDKTKGKAETEVWLEEAVAKWEAKRRAQAIEAGKRGGQLSLQQEVTHLKRLVSSLVDENSEAGIQLHKLYEEQGDVEKQKAFDSGDSLLKKSANGSLLASVNAVRTLSKLNSGLLLVSEVGVSEAQAEPRKLSGTGNGFHGAFKASSEKQDTKERIKTEPSMPACDNVPEEPQAVSETKSNGFNFGWFRPSDWKEWAAGVGVGSAFLAASMVVVKFSSPLPGGRESRGSDAPFASASATFTAPQFNTATDHTLPALYRKAQANVIELTENDFYAMLQRGPTFVMFYSPRCHHCQEMYAAWKDLPEKLDDLGFNMQVAKIDATKCWGLTEEYGIQGVPTLILFDGDEPLGSHEGPRDLDSLLEFIDKNLPF